VCRAATRRLVRILLVAPLLAATSAGARAQSLLCDTIRRGDTAAGVARRVTGRPESRYQPWFRIVDRTTVIPKSGYDRLVAGWQACIPAARRVPRVVVPGRRHAIVRSEPATTVSGGPAAALTAGASSLAESATTSLTESALTSVIANAPTSLTASPPTPPSPSPADTSSDWALMLAFLCVAPAAFGAAIGLGWQSVERVLTRRRALTREMQQFGDVFVRDFERPLRIDGGGGRAVRARLRWVPRHQRLEILLAPCAGRRYPNLDDHRRNVEYDVDRIAHRLRQYPFVRRPLRAEGEWVVIPFQFNPRSKTGAAV
jgi:hypothetical protein